MKLICLDIDGVLNCSFCKNKIDGNLFIMEDKIALLKQLIDRTGAKVLLTSTWRHGWIDIKNGSDTIDAKHFIALRDKLLEYGIELMDHTPVTNGSMNRRGEEIDLWVKSWTGEPVESLVLLDDLNGCYLRPYSGRLVRTSLAKGLLQKHVDLAVKILEKPLDKNRKEESVLPATMVHYQWSDDGETELCEKIEDTLKESITCYHCDQKIETGEPVVYLFSLDGDEYALHPKCAENSCTQA